MHNSRPLASPESGRILIVDDDPQVRGLLTDLLGEHGYEVVAAPDGDTAWEIVLDGGCDLVLSDLMMPGLDGFSLCRRIRETPTTRHIPVFSLTGLGSREVVLTALDAGADHVLVKPLELAETLIRVRNAVRMKRLADQSAGSRLLHGRGETVERYRYPEL